MRRLTIAAIAAVLFLIPTIAGAQILPSITFDPDPLVFPDTRSGQTSAPLDLTIINDSASLSLFIFSMKLADAQNFSIVSDGCSGRFTPPQGSCNVAVQFSPGASGNYATSISVISLSRQVIDSVGVMGKGVAPAATLAPQTIDFGHHSVGQPSEIRLAVLLNSGNEALSITDITTADPFAVTDDCGTSLAPQASCNLSVAFNPAAAGAFSGAVTITDDAPDSPQSIPLTGTGIEPGSPDIGFSTASVDFGTELVGTTSDPSTITVTSNGTADLNIDSIVASQNFAVTHDCPAVMPTASTCTLSVTFTPPMSGAVSGTLVISDNATDSPQSISLSGEGITQGAPQADLSATQIEFGNQTIEQSSQVSTVTITNRGSEDLAITSMDILGDDASSYSQRNDCVDALLAPSASCTADVTFTPPVLGQLIASLSISDNAADSPQSVVLSGTGVEAGGGDGGCSLTRASGTSITLWGFFVFVLLPSAALWYRRAVR